MSLLPDPASRFGAQVRRRLVDEQLIWFTTTGKDDTPQPNPVWFLWEQPDALLIYNRIDAVRIAHIAARPRVAANLDGNGFGGDIVILLGTAAPAPDAPPANEHPAYVDKYGAMMRRVGGSTEGFAADYPHAMRMNITKIRGH